MILNWLAERKGKVKPPLVVGIGGSRPSFQIDVSSTALQYYSIHAGRSREYVWTGHGRTEHAISIQVASSCKRASRRCRHGVMSVLHVL